MARHVGKLLPVNALQSALAAEIRAEMAAQRISATDMQQRTGIKHASWRNWFVTAVRPAPVPEVDKVCAVLGVRASELLRRAEARIDGSPARPPLDPEITQGLSKRQVRKIEEAREAFDASEGNPEERANEPPESGTAAS